MSLGIVARSRFVLLAAVLVCGFASTGWAQADASAAKDHPSKGMMGMITQRMWWNQQKLVDELKLSQNQRDRLDQKFLETAATERGSRRKLADLRRKYEQALRGGNWSGARQTANELADQQKDVMHAQLLSRVDMLSVLTDDQRTTLLNSHGRLLVSNWLSHGNVGPRGRGAKRGAAKGDASAGDDKDGDDKAGDEADE